jgi:hypothetical protein
MVPKFMMANGKLVKVRRPALGCAARWRAWRAWLAWLGCSTRPGEACRSSQPRPPIPGPPPLLSGMPDCPWPSAAHALPPPTPTHPPTLPPQVLIHTDVTKYLEFKSVDGSYVLNKGKVYKVGWGPGRLGCGGVVHAAAVCAHGSGLQAPARCTVLAWVPAS